MSAMTMVYVSAVGQAVTNEEDAIQAGSEGNEHYLDNIEEHFSLLFLKDRVMELLPTTEEIRLTLIVFHQRRKLV